MTRRRLRPAAVKLAAIVAAIIALVSGLAACGGGSPPVQAPATDPAAVAVVTGDATSPAAIETPTIEALLNRAFDHNAGLRCRRRRRAAPPVRHQTRRNVRQLRRQKCRPG